MPPIERLPPVAYGKMFVLTRIGGLTSSSEDKSMGMPLPSRLYKSQRKKRQLNTHPFDDDDDADDDDCIFLTTRLASFLLTDDDDDCILLMTRFAAFSSEAVSSAAVPSAVESF